VIDDWVREVAAAHPEKTWLKPHVVEPPKPEIWQDYYWEAWQLLRYDRPYVGQFGIEMPISYLAVDRYAERNGIDGEAFDHLLYFINLIDDVFREQSAAERAASLPTPPKTN
jgi:hypothetical protein